MKHMNSKGPRNFFWIVALFALLVIIPAKSRAETTGVKNYEQTKDTKY